MKILLPTLLMLSSFSNAFAKSDKQTQIIQNYLSVQKSLVSGDFEGFKNSAKTLQKSAKQASAELDKETKELAEAPSLKEGRQEFKDVSALMLKKHENSLKDDLMVVYCPMAGAKWIQKKGKIENPYMGKEMTECGEKI